MNKNIACAYVYFDYKDQKKQNLTGLLSSLLAQLVRNRNEISQVTIEIHDASRSSGMSPSSDEYFLMLESQIKTFDRVFIVVDALDECIDDMETNTRKTFLGKLHELTRRAHILFTSRPMNIERQVKADRKIEIVAKDDDLRKYLQSRIDTFDHMKYLVDVGVRKDKSFGDNILRSIVRKSQGMQVSHLRQLVL